MLNSDNITVLDISRFTVDVTLKFSRLYKRMKNDIHLRSGRNQLSMYDGLYMEHYTKIRILPKVVIYMIQEAQLSWIVHKPRHLSVA